MQMMPGGDWESYQDRLKYLQYQMKNIGRNNFYTKGQSLAEWADEARITYQRDVLPILSRGCRPMFDPWGSYIGEYDPEEDASLQLKICMYDLTQALQGRKHPTQEK